MKLFLTVPDENNQRVELGRWGNKNVNKMIYDYRQDIINLIKHTENNEQSLSQTLYCLQVISKALLNGQYLQKPLNDILQNKATSELSDSKTSKQIPSETKDETTTTESPLKIIKKAETEILSQLLL